MSLTVSGLLLAALLSGCGDGGDGATPTTSPPTTAATSTTSGATGTTSCEAPERGYRLQFPETWFVNDPTQPEPCRFFHPEPFSVGEATEATGIAVSVQLNPLPFDRVVPAPEGSPASVVLDRRTTMVDERQAVRVETRSSGEALLPSGTRAVTWFVDASPGTLVATTSEAAAAGRYGDNVEVLDQMVGSLTILDRSSACSAARAAPEPAPQPALPPPVAAMHTAIVEAAKRCDYEALARLALEGGSGFSYSFGEQGRPADFWEAAESDGRAVMRALVEVLGAPFSTRTVDGTTQYVWPSAYGYERWEDVPEADREALRRLYGEEDLRRFARFGSYVGHRAGITETGDWIFLVAGD